MNLQAKIAINHVHKNFGTKKVLDDITLQVNDSEVFGLLGPSGAGKSTLVKIIAGIETQTDGTVKVLNQLMPRLDLMNEMGYMAQSDALYNELSAYENLDFFAAIYGIRGKERKRRIEEVMELVNLQDDSTKIVHNYSGGMKRRLSLAIALLHKPKILILDEPTVGIDPVLRNSIWGEFGRLKNAGTTIVVTTHVMDEAEKCERLAMIRDGKLIAVGSPEQLKAETSQATIEGAFLFYGGAVK
jgi:ABC-2 type transport system ATP-binding protein